MKSIRVVAAIIERDGHIFATQRGYGNYKDWWEFPGGKIEPGETAEQALKREIKEELDTEISVGEHLITVEYDYPEFHLVMDCFMCSVVSGQLTLLEHEAARWLPVDDMWQVKWLAADYKVIEAIEKRGLSVTNSKLPKDPHMLVSYVNMMLRDRYHSLTDFCEDNSVDPEEMIQKLSNAGYEYNETINQFR